MVSDGGTRPFRAHFRDPSFANLQAMPALCEGSMVSDVVVDGQQISYGDQHGILRPDPVLGTRLPGPGAVYISQTLNFRAPVKIGDTVEVIGAEGVVLRVRPLGRHNLDPSS